MTRAQRDMAVAKLQEAASEERRAHTRYVQADGTDRSMVQRAEAYEACIKHLQGAVLDA